MVRFSDQKGCIEYPDQSIEKQRIVEEGDNEVILPRSSRRMSSAGGRGVNALQSFPEEAQKYGRGSFNSQCISR